MLLQKDLHKFELRRAAYGRNALNEETREYNVPPTVIFTSRQPLRESERAAEYGLDPRYAYAFYVAPGDVKELDRIYSADGTAYEVRLIQKWQSYWRLLCEVVRG